MGEIKKFKHQQPSEELFVRNLQMLMEKQGVSEAELSRQTSIPQPTLHKILSGKTSDPRISTLKTLAGYFKVSLDDLYSELGVSPVGKAIPQGQSIPVISWEDCVKSKDPSKKLSPTNWDDWVVAESGHNKHAYALISRPSMEPRFPRGSTLIVDPTVMPTDGDLAIVQYPNTNAATLRELMVDGPNKMLMAPNENMPSDKLDKNIVIIGTVIQSRFSY